MKNQIGNYSAISKKSKIIIALSCIVVFILLLKFGGNKNIKPNNDNISTYLFFTPNL